MIDTAADHAAVELDLFLTFSLGTAWSTARLSRQVCPASSQSRQEVLQLRHFHLRARLATAGVLGEDVDDQSGTVDHREIHDLFEVSNLHRREVRIEDKQAGVAGGGSGRDIGGLTWTDKGRGHDPANRQDRAACIFESRSVGESREFFEVQLGERAGFVGIERADEKRGAPAGGRFRRERWHILNV